MRRWIHPLTAWSLVVLLTTVAGVRDGLHLIPGMGHEVTVGGQVLLLGETQTEPTDETLAPACCFVARCKTNNTVQILDEDDCPLCHFFGMKLAGASVWMMTLAELQVRMAALDPLDAKAIASHVYQARAPPHA